MKISDWKKNRRSIEIFPWFLDHLPSTCCFWYPKLATVCLRHVWGSFYTHCTPFFRVTFGVKEATLTQTDGDVVVLLAQETYAAQAYISCLCVRTHLNWRKAYVRIGFHFPANTIEQVTSMLLFLLESVLRECINLIFVFLDFAFVRTWTDAKPVYLQLCFYFY